MRFTSFKKTIHGLNTQNWNRLPPAEFQSYSNARAMIAKHINNKNDNHMNAEDQCDEAKLLDAGDSLLSTKAMYIPRLMHSGNAQTMALVHAACEG